MTIELDRLSTDLIEAFGEAVAGTNGYDFANNLNGAVERALAGASKYFTLIQSNADRLTPRQKECAVINLYTISKIFENEVADLTNPENLMRNPENLERNIEACQVISGACKGMQISLERPTPPRAASKPG